MKQQRNNSTVLKETINMDLLLSLERALCSMYSLLYGFHGSIIFVDSFRLKCCKELIILIEFICLGSIVYVRLDFSRTLLHIFFRIFNLSIQKAMVSPLKSFL